MQECNDYTKHKEIIKYYSNNILKGKKKGDFRVELYLDKRETSEVFIVETEGEYLDEMYYGTVGTFPYSIDLQVDNKPLRVEFVAVAQKEYELFPNILSTCCFHIINSHYACYPGVVYPNVIKLFYPEFNMKHLMLTNPYTWDSEFTLDMGDCIVTWLEALPISDSEYEYIREHGSDAFEDYLEQQEVDLLDLNRPSVV